MSENTPKISVIVPVYKAEKYLHRCVDSLLAQTFQDFEILLVDDGSPDRSGEICDEYAMKDTRVRVYHKENGGVSSARNLGLDNARGEYVCFVDSDDYVESTFMDDFELNDLDVDIYLQGYKRMDNTKILAICSFLYCILVENASEIYIKSEPKNILNSPVCKLFRRKIIQTNKLYFDLNTSYGEDHLFVLNYLPFVKCGTISDKVSYNYVCNQNVSLTRRLVPYSELLYYAVQCNKLQRNLMRIFSNNYKSECDLILNIRSYTNIMRIIHDCVKGGDFCVHDFRRIKRDLKAIRFSYKGLRCYQVCLMFLLFNLPCLMALFLFRFLMLIKC